MAVDLTTIFGQGIKVVAQPSGVDIQFTGFAGANGLTSMNMGARGREIIITGTLASTGAGYTGARTNLQAVINGIEAYLYPDTVAADYAFEGDTYQQAIFVGFELMRDRDGKAFYWTSEGYVMAFFVCRIVELV